MKKFFLALCTFFCVICIGHTAGASPYVYGNDIFEIQEGDNYDGSLGIPAGDPLAVIIIWARIR